MTVSPISFIPSSFACPSVPCVRVRVCCFEDAIAVKDLLELELDCTFGVRVSCVYAFVERCENDVGLNYKWYLKEYFVVVVVVATFPL